MFKKVRFGLVICCAFLCVVFLAQATQALVKQRCVEGSLSLTVSSGKTAGTIDVPLVEGLSTEDSTEAEQEPDFLREDDEENKDEAGASPVEDDSAHDTVVFTMRSESGAEYAVEVYTAGDLDRADTTITRK